MRQIKIFVTIGSTYPLDRLIIQMDKIGADKKYNIFAQIGESQLEPKNIKWTKFLNYTAGQKKMDNSDIIISHAGIGTIIEALSKNKKLILFPRLKEYGEAVDDHQLEICEAFYKKFGINYTVDLKKISKLIIKTKLAKIPHKGSLLQEITKQLSLM